MTVGRERLEKLLVELEQKVIKVGYFEHSKYTDGTPIAYIAAIQEQGYVKGGIPARPTLHPAMDANRGKYKQGVAKAVRGSLVGGDLTTGLNAVGEVASGDVKEAIIALTSPALKQSTIDARKSRHYAGKASDKPLVDSGQMLRAVTYSVEDV